MRKKTTLALVLMMNLACAMAQKSGTTGPLSWNYNETSKELTSDGIDNATTEGQQADKAERVYSRDGVQLRGTLSQQQKGVYIVGGKKVVKR